MSLPPTPLPKSITQPGLDGPAYTATPTHLTALDEVLPAGVSLHEALAEMLARTDLKGAYMRLQNAPVSGLHYVIPDLAPDTRHVAWYSKTYKPEMPGKIIDAGITCGSYGNQPFYHCHGMIEDAAGTALMGHLLPETCILAAPLRVTGIGFRQARFKRMADVQTGFELFKTEALAPATDSDGLLLRIGPNVEITSPLVDACRDAGWRRAKVHGLGSIIGAHFADGSVMHSFATEFLITEGHIDLDQTPQIALEIALVGLNGAFMSGKLQVGSNPVLITAEIVLQRLQGEAVPLG